MDDNEFGPRLPGHFDFTLLFEHSFFEIAPSGIVICATPFYVWKLFFKTPIISPGVLLPLKILAAAALVGAQAASIGLWQLSDLVNAVTDAATIMSCIAAVCIAVIVFVSHMYSTHSSRFLGFYLTLTMLLDIATTISYFNRDNLHTIASVHVAVPALKIVIMALEEISKRSLVRDKEWAATLGQGAFAGFWNTSLLVWINTTLFVGFRTNMSARILPGIDEQFDSETLYREFSRHWAQADKSSKYALFKACAKTVPSQLAQIILPRSLSIGFTLAQPFLLQTIVNVVSSQQISIDVMRGLVIATALIYVGRAVSLNWRLFSQRFLTYHRFLSHGLRYSGITLPPVSGVYSFLPSTTRLFASDLRKRFKRQPLPLCLLMLALWKNWFLCHLKVGRESLNSDLALRSWLSLSEPQVSSHSSQPSVSSLSHFPPHHKSLSLLSRCCTFCPSQPTASRKPSALERAHREPCCRCVEYASSNERYQDARARTYYGQTTSKPSRGRN